MPTDAPSSRQQTIKDLTANFQQQVNNARQSLNYNEHRPEDLSESQCKSYAKRRRLMQPTGPALRHPAAPLLQRYSEQGCPANIEPTYPLDLLEQAIKRGAHPSATTAAAAKALRLETEEKVRQGYARLIPWSELRDNLPANIRISPIAAIPHKSRDFRMILDLSFGFSREGTPWPSVNESTNDANAPLNSMTQLGQVLPRLIHALATSPEEKGPWIFAKLDIKDGFWRLLVPEQDEFNFCYVLPQTSPDDPIQLVVPTSLQMGWRSSPPFFCAATETARDVAQTLAQQPQLPPHPMEDTMLQDLHKLQHPTQWPDSTLEARRKDFAHLLEVYVDDFIGALQATDLDTVRHHSRALLHAIHSIFPAAPPNAHPDAEPISQKKLQEGEGTWACRKEILGWIFDGISRTIELPPTKLSKLRQSIREALKKGHLPVTAYQSLVGKLQHAALGIPAGRGLLGPLFKLLPDKSKKGPKHKSIQLKHGSPARQALRDFKTMLKLVAHRPTHCQQLVPGWPHFVGFCDACKYGAGGVWLSGKEGLHPVVWRVKWPKYISDQLVSPTNPKGSLTINDLEMAGLLLHYLVLERLADLKHKHAAAWCDNTSTVSWGRRLTSSKSIVGQRLVRALALRHVVTESSPLAPWSIAGANNKMADLASRSFHKAGPDTFDLDDTDFLTKFNSDFPLTQGASWRMHTLPNSITSLVFSELSQRPQPMGSWLRLTKTGSTSGSTGNISLASMASRTPTSKAGHSPLPSPLSVPLPTTYELDTQEESIRSELAKFRRRWQPLPRPSNWTLNPAPPTSQAQPTTPSHSNNKCSSTSSRTP